MPRAQKRTCTWLDLVVVVVPNTLILCVWYLLVCARTRHRFLGNSQIFGTIFIIIMCREQRSCLHIEINTYKLLLYAMHTIYMNTKYLSVYLASQKKTSQSDVMYRNMFNDDEERDIFIWEKSNTINWPWWSMGSTRA